MREFMEYCVELAILICIEDPIERVLVLNGDLDSMNRWANTQ